ncbi:unnamed protein product [Cylicocyclus nassatus]|uniref:Uncharacterized protein n=1 Tax=Cylicocyclus nassatus TaxID=53992 RepID=A0AA36HA11_CYLNA|nr:unnamed protein product [Cylicocyclus nassatus]
MSRPYYTCPQKQQEQRNFFAAMKIYFSLASDFLQVYFKNCKESLKTICVAHYLKSVDIAVNARDVCRYLNDYLRKYGRGNEWNIRPAQADVVFRAQMRENSLSNDNRREERSTEVEDVSMPPPPAVMRVD